MANMNFESMDTIAAYGFQGFIKISDLRASGCKEIPPNQGIYLVLRPLTSFPKLVYPSTGGYFKGKDPTVPLDELNNHWVEGTIVVYIGKAGGVNSTRTLRDRLQTYLKFGEGKPVAHWGGRYIWQLADADELVICWKTTPRSDPALEEKKLIRAFAARYCKRPFANLRS